MQEHLELACVQGMFTSLSRSHKLGVLLLILSFSEIALTVFVHGYSS